MLSAALGGVAVVFGVRATLDLCWSAAVCLPVRRASGHRVGETYFREARHIDVPVIVGQNCAPEWLSKFLDGWLVALAQSPYTFLSFLKKTEKERFRTASTRYGSRSMTAKS